MTNTQPDQDNSAEYVNIDVEVGIIVQSLIFRRRMTLQEVGDVIGCAKSSMSRKLRGHTAFSLAELYKLGRALEVDPADLLPRLDSNQQPCDYQQLQVNEVEDDERLEYWGEQLDWFATCDTQAPGDNWFDWGAYQHHHGWAPFSGHRELGELWARGRDSRVTRAVV